MAWTDDVPKSSNTIASDLTTMNGNFTLLEPTVNPARSIHVVTGSRAFDTNYENTTGKSMTVQVSCGLATGSDDFIIYVGAASPATVGIGRGSANVGYDHVTFEVPAGMFYRVAWVNTGARLLGYWIETY